MNKVVVKTMHANNFLHSTGELFYFLSYTLFFYERNLLILDCGE